MTSEENILELGLLLELPECQRFRNPRSLQGILECSGIYRTSTIQEFYDSCKNSKTLLIPEILKMSTT